MNYREAWVSLDKVGFICSSMSCKGVVILEYTTGGSSFKDGKHEPGVAVTPSSALVALVSQQQRDLPEKWGTHQASSFTVMQAGLANAVQRGGGCMVTQPTNNLT